MSHLFKFFYQGGFYKRRQRFYQEGLRWNDSNSSEKASVNPPSLPGSKRQVYDTSESTQ
jgi:hypothetical protein